MALRMYTQGYTYQTNTHTQGNFLFSNLTHGKEKRGNKYLTDVQRYGFQGQEMDDEVKGEGNSVNYKYRMHDPRIGRFFAVDPLAHEYPLYSPYSFSGNQVIHTVELEGLEPHFDENHRLIGYKVQKNQGPSQIAADLNSRDTQKDLGYTLFTKATWQDIVLSNMGTMGKDPGVTNIGNIKDKGYESLNVNPGDIIGLDALFKKEKLAIGFNDDMRSLVSLLELEIETKSTRISEIDQKIAKNSKIVGELRAEVSIILKTTLSGVENTASGREGTVVRFGETLRATMKEMNANALEEENKSLNTEKQMLEKQVKRGKNFKTEIEQDLKKIDGGE